MCMHDLCVCTHVHTFRQRGLAQIMAVAANNGTSGGTPQMPRQVPRFVAAASEMQGCVMHPW